MIDIEAEIYDYLYQKVIEQYPDIYMSSEYFRQAPRFPAVSFEEKANSTYRDTQTQDSLENHAAIMFEVNVYTNEMSGRKSMAREIMAVVDEAMQTIGFDRVYLNNVPNLADATIYRLTGRWRAIVGQDKTIFRRRK